MVTGRLGIGIDAASCNVDKLAFSDSSVKRRHAGEMLGAGRAALSRRYAACFGPRSQPA
jgi:hypothetical protein